jgi:cysteine desulfurase/selenocysteine lyase
MILAEPTWTPSLDGVALGSRALFPDLELAAYLNHAAVSPASTLLREAVGALLADYARRGVHAVGPWIAQRGRLKGRLSELLGAQPQDLAFVANTSASVTSVATCFPFREGDRVLCFEGEFPTNVTPWQQAVRRCGGEVVWMEADAFRTDEALDALDRVLAGGIRLVAVSLVQFQTGLRMPVEAIAERAHAHGAEVFVDAIQGAGIVPFDVASLGVDYLGTGSHKWLMGLEGAGILWVHPDRQAALEPRLAAWLSHDDPLRFLFEPDQLRYDRPLVPGPAFLEGGALNGAGLAALEASLAAILHLGVEAAFEHGQRYLDAVEPGLVERGFVSERSTDPSRRSGTLSLRPPAGVDLRALRDALEEHGVSVSIPDGRLRLAPHWPNHLDEVPVVLAAMDLALPRARS